MSKADFDELVQIAVTNHGLSGMEKAVEKELLHYEIFNAMDHAGLLKGLVFQGGTSLRLCWGSERFSEDLDFAGGVGFNAAGMARIKSCIEETIGRRYGLAVQVKEPKRKDRIGERVPVSAWQVSVITSPGNPSIPQQRVKLEVAAVEAHTREVMPLRKNYSVVADTGTVLVQVESKNEILADKLLAFPSSLFGGDGSQVDLGSRQIRHRDIWDIAWLTASGASPDATLVAHKVSDYAVTDYAAKVRHAQDVVQQVVDDDVFGQQMARFLDSATFQRTIGRPEYRQYLGRVVRESLGAGLQSELSTQVAGQAIEDDETRGREGR
jgi:predicted nucleotidyltransferase component of viral defense system